MDADRLPSFGYARCDPDREWTTAKRWGNTEYVYALVARSVVPFSIQLFRDRIVSNKGMIMLVVHSGFECNANLGRWEQATLLE